MKCKAKMKVAVLLKATLATATVFVFGACTHVSERPSVTEPSVSLGGEQAFSFIVMGDTPYDDFGITRENGTSKDQKMIRTAVARIKTDVKPPFIIHVGDTKKGSTECTEYIYDRFAALIKDMEPIPVMYTPGDNEWVDCDRKGDSELAKLAYIRNRYFQTPPVNSAAFGYASQSEQAENASWNYKQVHFATLHVPGTNNARNWVTEDNLSDAKTSADLRDAANQKWLDVVFKRAQDNGARAVIISIQADIVAEENNNPATIGTPCSNVYDTGLQVCDGFADFRKTLAAKSVEFKRPVLLIHGDTHDFSLNQDLLGYGAPNLWRLNGAGDGVVDVTLVNVDLEQAMPFSASGLLTGVVPNP